MLTFRVRSPAITLSDSVSAILEPRQHTRAPCMSDSELLGSVRNNLLGQSDRARAFTHTRARGMSPFCGHRRLIVALFNFAKAEEQQA